MLSTITLSFSFISLAKYVEGKEVNQPAYGLGGERKKSIFFNANVWKQGKDSSGNIVDAAFYFYAWYHNPDTANENNDNSRQCILAPAAHVTPTVHIVSGDSGTVMDLYVFEFDTTLLNRFLFVRWNPEREMTTSLDSEHGMWNQTNDITYNSSLNYYCIDSWGSGTPAKATANSNEIVKNNSTDELTWRN